MSESQEVFDILDGLTSPTADEVYTDVREYDTRDVLAAVGATAKAGGGGSQPNAARVQYIEWTPGGPLTQTTDLPAGAHLFACWVGVFEAFDATGFGASLTVGDTNNATTFSDGFSLSAAGTVFTTADLGGHGTDGRGFDVGPPISNDYLADYPVGTVLTGTLNPDGASNGMVRFYFVWAVASLAEPGA